MTVYVCPSRDIECGDFASNWCATCPKHTMTGGVDANSPLGRLFKQQRDTIEQLRAEIAARDVLCGMMIDFLVEPIIDGYGDLEGDSIQLFLESVGLIEWYTLTQEMFDAGEGPEDCAPGDTCWRLTSTGKALRKIGDAARKNTDFVRKLAQPE